MTPLKSAFLFLSLIFPGIIMAASSSTDVTATSGYSVMYPSAASAAPSVVASNVTTVCPNDPTSSAWGYYGMFALSAGVGWDKVDSVVCPDINDNYSAANGYSASQMKALSEGLNLCPSTCIIKRYIQTTSCGGAPAGICKYYDAACPAGYSSIGVLATDNAVVTNTGQTAQYPTTMAEYNNYVSWGYSCVQETMAQTYWTCAAYGGGTGWTPPPGFGGTPTVTTYGYAGGWNFLNYGTRNGGACFTDNACWYPSSGKNANVPGSCNGQYAWYVYQAYRMKCTTPSFAWYYKTTSVVPSTLICQRIKPTWSTKK